jgi:hypothetical protein
MGRACSTHGEKRDDILVRQPEGKRALDTVGTVILKWILKREIGWGGVEWIDLVRDRDQ